MDGSGNTSGEETYQDHGPAQPLTVKSLTVVAVACNPLDNGATIIGTATVDGSGVHEFEIDVTDQGEPGTLDTYRILIPDIPYDSGIQTLEGGNIQVNQ